MQILNKQGESEKSSKRHFLTSNNYKRIIILSSFLLVAFFLSATLSVINQRQDIRQRAEAKQESYQAVLEEQSFSDATITPVSTLDSIDTSTSTIDQIDNLQKDENYGIIRCPNLALKKPAASSGYLLQNTPDKAVDGQVSTFWQSNQSSGAWLQIDLGASYTINQVKLIWFWDDRFGTSASSKIQVSSDTYNWIDVTKSVHNKTNNNRQKETLNFTPVSARYVRFYGEQWNGSRAEVQTLEVYNSNCVTIPKQTIYDVKKYGAVGNGTTNDTLIIQKVIDKASLAGGGIVFFPPGTYATQQIRVKSNVTLQGAGRNVSTIKNPDHLGITGPIIVIPLAVSNFAVKDLSVTGTLVKEYNSGIQVSGASKGVISNVGVSNAHHYAVMVDGDNASNIGASDISLENIYVTNMRLNSVGTGKTINSGGVGVWIYKGAHDVTINNLTVDSIDSTGFVLDAGTNSSPIATRVYNVTARNITVRNAGQGGSLAANPAGILFEGGQNSTLSNFVIDGAGAKGSGAPGLMLQEDQNAVPSSGNTITDGVIKNVQSGGIGLWNTQNNKISNIKIQNIGLSQPAQVSALMFSTTTGVKSGLSPHDNIDNTLNNIQITQDEGVGKYDFGVLFDSATRLNVYRNKVLSSTFGKPRLKIVEVSGSNKPPLEGLNANYVDLSLQKL